MSQFPSGSQRGRGRYDGRGGGRRYGSSSGQGYGDHGDSGGRGGNDHGYGGRGDGYGRGGGGRGYGGRYDGGRSAGRGHAPGYGGGGDGYGRGSGGSGYSRGSGRGYGGNDNGSNNQGIQYTSNRGDGSLHYVAGGRGGSDDDSRFGHGRGGVGVDTHASDGNQRGRGRNTYLVPDLHQANFGQITDGMARVNITGGGGAQLQTCSSTGFTKYPPRPAHSGQIGQICTVRTNHFLIQLSPSIYVHHYNVTIEPETRRERNREVIKQLLESYSSSFRNLLLAYDGEKALYTASPLPLSPKEFKVTVLTNTGHQMEYTVAISLAAVVYMQNCPEVIQPLDIILRQTPSSMYIPVKQSFCHPSFGTWRLGGGLIAWKGFYQSVRQTQMGLSLNFDSSSAVFVEDLEVIEFVRQLIQNNGPPNSPLSRNEYIKVKNALKNFKVEVTHRGNIRRKYTISGLTSKCTGELTFPCGEDKKEVHVVKYFRETYGLNLKYTAWPCLLAGPKAKEIYLPMEVCKLVHGQKYTKGLNNMQTSALLKVNSQHPQQRENDIVDMVRRNDYRNDKYAEEFGIMINEHPTSVQARILPAPQVDYDHHSFRPSGGQWNMMNKRMFIGGTVKSWACINLAYDIVRDDRVRHFCSDLAKMCSNQGITFNAEPVHPHWNVDPDPDRLKETMARFEPHVRELDLLIFILPTNSSPLYGLVKLICETKIGLVSQCVLAESVNDQRRNMSILANLPSKINAKVGGTNMVIGGGLPKVGDKPTIIFGADVTHPSPGQVESPSIAAVVASIDWPHVTRYIPRYSSQAGGKEIIEDLGRMVKELLHSFAQVNKKPERIIFYRDGVGEGQFAQVLEHELKAIQEAWKDEFNESVVPPITFVVVQKRHRTKLFFDDANTHVRKDRSGNVPPGTLVDTMICHPSQFDFYLCSHAGIQGTSRPAHYHVLFDENNFSADDIQTLSNNLCYIYARCTRSVSYPAPTYYAHLVAYRARLYMEADDLQSDKSSVSVDDTTLAAGVSIKQVPRLCDNLQNSAIYC